MRRWRGIYYPDRPLRLHCPERFPSHQLTTLPTFHSRLLSSEGILNSRASRLSRLQRSHLLVFLSSLGGGGPITALTAVADIGPDDDDGGTSALRMSFTRSFFAEHIDESLL
jgi:hypothetical protein